MLSPDSVTCKDAAAPDGGPGIMLPTMSIVRCLLLVVAAAATVVTPSSGDVQGAPYGDLHWRLIGPFRGGRALAAVGVPDEPQHFYFGSVNGGVWETLDAGRTWQPIFDSQAVGSIGAIALAPSNPRVIYVGTGEADMRSDIAQGEGVFRSTDGGRTWTAAGLADSQQVARIIVHPSNPNLVYVAALGHPYGPNAERGVFRSPDGGRTWQKVLGPNPDTGAIDVLFEPKNPSILYAALWQTRRTPWNIYPPSNGPGSGLYASTDGGDHWVALTNGLPEHPGRIGLAISPTAPARVYALVDAEPGGGLYRSDDRGAHWRKVTGDTRIWSRGWYFGRITVDPSNPDRIWALNTIVLRSDDGGATFIALKGDPTGDDFHDLWIDPQHVERQILATDQGTLVTMNGGRTWSSWHNQPTGQFYHVSTDNRFPYFVYGAQQDSGAAGVPSRTTTQDGVTVTAFHEIVPGGENDNIAPDPDDPDVIYGGRVDRVDLRTGQTRKIDPTFAYPDQHRATWTLPLVFSRRDPRILYFARQQIYMTRDQGEHWAQISPDLTRPDPGVPSNLDAPTAAHDEGLGPRRGVVYAIGPSPLEHGGLWAGTDDGLVWRSRDEGAHWSDVTPPALMPWSKVGIIEPSHFDPETAYIAVDRHRLDDFAPYVYGTHDGGHTWTLLVSGIAKTHAVNVVREDPVRRGLLYAGTERGMYVSLDDGATWHSLQINLPATSVRDIEVKQNDLVIATHGRAFWILDDVTPLRQLAVSLSLGATRLLAPAAAVRLRPEPFTGTPFPKDEPAAANPPFGAHLDYVLADPATEVTLTIRDAQQNVVRQYSSRDQREAVDPAHMNAAPEWTDAPVTLSTAPGLHRFVWPIRWAAPPALAAGNAFIDGVWAIPDRYTVELGVDGRRFTQPLDILPDPRLNLPRAAYLDAYAMARRIEAARAEVTASATALRVIQRAITARLATANAVETSLLGPYLRELVDVTGVEPTVNPSNSFWRPAKALTTLRYLNDTLSELAAAVDGADAAPSPDARTGFSKIEGLVPPVLAAAARIRASSLDALNTQLTAAGRPRLEVPKVN